LLQARITEIVARLDKGPRGQAPPGARSTARETAPRFGAGCRQWDADDLDGLRQLLSFASQIEEEQDAAARAAATIRAHVHAVGVAVYGSRAQGLKLLGECGSSSQSIAQRAVNAGQSIDPEPSGGWVEAAVPIHYLGRVVGAISIRWSVDGPENPRRAVAFMSVCATACAPLVYVLLERDHVPDANAAPLDIVGVSVSIEEVRKAIRRAANAPFTVLIEGESGSGKELVARAIHKCGHRRDRRFLAFNCAAMPEDLVDAELFGHAKGAFTGAAVERPGLFESADGGTVFLDEIGELSARAQAKVLRVLQEGEVRRIGETVTRPFDTRVVAATNRCLRNEVVAGRFRHDLFYRLDVIRIVVPPLRERMEDIPLLAARFWREAADRVGSKAVLGQGALAALARYDWPGNIRELQNALAALVVNVRPRGVVGASQLPAGIARAGQLESCESLESARLKFDERFVRAALAREAGHRGRTAAALGISRQGLAKLMQRLHLDA
jgi:transcriptional regulator with PAS, ATPase and Fis domain